jgi:tetratricopeptide (TPR) repeat protein
MDPRLQQIADALGVGDYQTTRQLADLLLESATDPTLRAEASAYLVESCLAEGDFAGARAAAERVNDEESLVRVNKLEAAYHAEVGRLQRIIASTENSEEACTALLQMARAHARFGQAARAKQGYWSVLERDQHGAYAMIAAQEMLTVEEVAAGTAGARSLCLEIIGSDPTGLSAAGAIRWLSGDSPCQRILDAELVAILTDVMETFSGTLADRESRCALARRAVSRARGEYERRNYLAVVGLLQETLGIVPGNADEAAEALHWLGLAYLGASGPAQEAKAADCFARLLEEHPAAAARLGTPYHLGAAYYRIGQYDAAIEQFEAYLRGFPQGPFAEYATERIQECRALLGQGASDSRMADVNQPVR